MYKEENYKLTLGYRLDKYLTGMYPRKNGITYKYQFDNGYELNASQTPKLQHMLQKVMSDGFKLGKPFRRNQWKVKLIKDNKVCEQQILTEEQTSFFAVLASHLTEDGKSFTCTDDTVNTFMSYIYDDNSYFRFDKGELCID